jgi:glutathionyl-hydroquinone reductase
MTDVFNLIYSLRDVKKIELEITEHEKFIIDQFYKLVKNDVYKRGFLKACKIYQTETMELDIYVVCDTLTETMLEEQSKKLGLDYGRS